MSTPADAEIVVQDAEVVTQEALEILGLTNPSTIARMVREGRLAPSRKLPGKTGAYMFRRSDIEALRDDRAAAKAAVGS